MSRPLRPLVLAAAVAAAALAGCTRAPEIERESVERVLATLADDDMEGRAAFTPGADRAADFIASEFEAIGLAPLEGVDGYLQEFPVHTVTTESVAVELDGQPVPAERTVAVLTEESVEWGPAGDVQVLAIGPDDDAMASLMGVRRADADTLVLMHAAAHGDLFARLRRFWSSANRTLRPDEDPSMVVALVDDTAPDTFRVQATATRTEERLANVVGTIPGRRADELVLLSAHYDHVGMAEEPVDGDTVFNGANDDASGTTAVIELARFFAASGTPERTLVFVAFTAEESGGFGSRHFSRQVDPQRIVAMINIEMIGKVAAQGASTIWMTGFERSDLGTILDAAVEDTGYDIIADPYPDQNLFYRSDNATLARLGVPAHSFSTTPIDVDEDYHQLSDEIETLDLEHITGVIRALADAVEPLAYGEARPSRIDASQVR